jgi:hypothetical protein
VVVPHEVPREQTARLAKQRVGLILLVAAAILLERADLAAYVLA